VSHVGLWHFSDMAELADDVGCWGRSGQVAANLLEGSEDYFGLRIFAPPSGHLTLWGVRVALKTIRWSAGLSGRERRANAASTIHGSRAKARPRNAPLVVLS
jgi:hypothetical protein